MSKYNCINCGAPIDYELNKCPYCGTYYCDLSEMTVGEVVMLKVNIPEKGKVLARAILTNLDVSAESEVSRVYTNSGHVIMSQCLPSVTADMHFMFVDDGDGKLFTMVKE